MDMDQSAVFLAGSILTMIGFIVIVMGIVIINNLFHKYWKPVRFVIIDPYTDRKFADTEQQHIEAQTGKPADVDKSKEPQLK